MQVTAWQDDNGGLHLTEEAMHRANKQRSLDAFLKQIDAYMDRPGNKLEIDEGVWVEGRELCAWLDVHHACALVIRDYIDALLPSAV